MPMWMRAAGIGGTILVLLTLVITLLKQIIAFIAFLTGTLKILIFVVFAVLFIAVGLMIFKTWQANRRKTE